MSEEHYDENSPKFGYRVTKRLDIESDFEAAKVDKLAIAFQPDAVEVELRKLPFLARFTLYLILALIVATVIWAAVAEVDRSVTARGKLVSQSRTVVQQPIKSSIIRSLKIRAGDQVREGDLLFTLDPTITEADKNQLEARAAALTAELERLDAESSGTLFTPKSETVDQVMQLGIYKKRALEREAALSGFEARIKEAKAELDVSRAQESKIAAEKKLADLRLKNAETLQSSNSGTAISVFERRSVVLQLEASLKEKLQEQVGVEQKLKGIEFERDLYIVGEDRKVEDRRVELINQIAQLNLEIEKANRVGDFDEFRASTDGIILETTQKSVGSIVGAGEVLFTLVPLTTNLDVELELTPKDIGWVQLNQPVRIKLDPFPFQRHGTLEGVLSSISPDSLQRSVGGVSQIYYKARVTIKEDKLRNLPPNFDLLPGITSTAEIRIGKRTVLSYITDPFHRALDQSLKEPN